MSDVPKPSPWARIRRALLGNPIPTSKAHHERLSPFVGLAVFASDSLSSVAYATEAMLMVLILYGAIALQWQMGISLAIAGLIAIITFSYRQTIRAYPQGGGSYIVASDNLGEKPGVVAGSALLVDYILTVAVSVSAGVAAVSSAFPVLHPYLVHLASLFIGILCWLNLRGIKESGALFAIPTYGFIVTMFAMVGAGIYKALTAGPVEQQIITEPGVLGSGAALPVAWVVLRTFAAGCTALTGIEAVSDGTQAFRKPEQKNAGNTLVRMAIILATLFLGMGFIVTHMPELRLFDTKNPEFRTVASQVAGYSFGHGSIMFFVVQAFTALILLLAANTAYADFPRVASFLARDGFLPRYMARQGDRIVFHNGIIVLSLAAIGLVWFYRGELDTLLPLYAIGVFTAFSLSQAGMVAHWNRLRTEGWRRSLAINLLGTILCVAVLIIISVTKFEEGAWKILILMPTMYVLLRAIKRRYTQTAEELKVGEREIAPAGEHLVLLLVPRVHNGLLQALEYSKQLKGEVQAVHVTLDEKKLPDLQRQWNRHGGDVPLVVLQSPFRSLTEPVADYVDELRKDRPGLTITVVVAEAVSRRWYHRFLSENVAQQLKQALEQRRNVVVATVRYFLS